MTRPGRVEVYRDNDGRWRWRRIAANGVVVGAATQSYGRLQGLAGNLEQNFLGFRLLDQDGGLTGPEWWLWGLEFAYADAALLTVPEDLVLGLGMRGHRIPVQVPDGYNLSSRR